MSNNNKKEELNIDNLSKYLNINNLTSNEQINLNQQYIQYYKTQPNYPILLMQIIVNDNNSNINSDIKLNASIQLKNFIKNYWKYSEQNNNNNFNNNNLNNNDIIIINENEKKNIKENIIDVILYSITNNEKKVTKQLTQCIKYILYYNFENLISFYGLKLNNFLKQNDQNKIYCSLLIIFKLSKIYENENFEKKKIYYNFFKTYVVNLLMDILSKSNDINNQIHCMFIYKIIKIFYKTLIHMNNLNIEILFNNIEQFENLISFLFFYIQSKVNKSFDDIIFKIKEISFNFLEKILRKFIPCKKQINNINNDDTVNKYLYENFRLKLYETIKIIFINKNENIYYINNKCKCIIYKLLTFYINRKYNDIKEDLLKIFISNNNNNLTVNISILLIFIEDSMLTENDINLFYNEPKTYINSNLNLDNNYLSLRYSVYHLLFSLMNYHDDNHILLKNKILMFSLFYNEMINIMKENEKNISIEENNFKNSNNNNINNYNNIIINTNSNKYTLIKESILFLLQNTTSLIIKFIQKISSKNTIEFILSNYIIPSFNTNNPFLLERICSFIECLRDYTILDQALVMDITKKFCFILENNLFNNILPVKIMCALAMPSLFPYKKIQILLKNNVKVLIKIYIKFFNETGLEEIIECIIEIIKFFKNDVKEYIEFLCEFFIKYFIKINNINNKNGISNDNYEDEENNNIIINNQILELLKEIFNIFLQDKSIFINIQKFIFAVLDFCININNVNNIFGIEQGLELLKDLLINNDDISFLYKYYNKIIEYIIYEIKNNYNNNNDNFENNNIEYIDDINKIIKIFLYKDQNILNYNNNINDTINYLNLGLKSFSNEEIFSFFQIYQLIFELYDKPISIHFYNNLIDKYLSNTIDNIDNNKINDNNNIIIINNLCELISSCIIFDNISTFNYKKIITFWLSCLSKTNSKKNFHYNIIAICSILLLINNDLLTDVIIKILMQSLYDLLAKFKQKKEILSVSTNDSSDNNIKNIHHDNKNNNNNYYDIEEEINDMNINEKVDEILDFYNEIQTQFREERNYINNNNNIEEFNDLNNIDKDDEDEDDFVFHTFISIQNEINCIKRTFEIIGNDINNKRIKNICGDKLINDINKIISFNNNNNNIK